MTVRLVTPGVYDHLSFVLPEVSLRETTEGGNVQDPHHTRRMLHAIDQRTHEHFADPACSSRFRLGLGNIEVIILIE
jgi:hypothetical protein